MKNFMSKWQLIKGAAFIITIAGSTYAYAMFQGGFVSWFLFYSVLPFLIYMIALFFYPLSDIKAVRTIEKSHYMAGERMDVQIELKRRIPFPLYYAIVKEVLPPSLRQDDQPKKMRFLWLSRTLRFSYSIDELPRGDHRLLHLCFKTGDLLGLVEKEKRLFTQGSVLVYPHLEKVFVPKEVRSEGARRANAQMNAPRNRSLTSSIRAYQPGDRFSWIDWKATARKDELMTREFEREEHQSYMIYLDRSVSGNVQDFERAVSYAASFMRAVLQSQTAAGLVSVGEQRAIFSVAKGEQHFRNVYRHLAAVQPDARMAFTEVMKQESIQTLHVPRLIHVLILQVVTREIMQQLQSFAGSGSSFFIVVISPDSSQQLMIQSLKKVGMNVYWLSHEETLT
ncbi:DUF58 domain-containing protein [Bacillus tianshenii]|nr:DUF58 domain-containing protein [Bacillus tianshenii]